MGGRELILEDWFHGFQDLIYINDFFFFNNFGGAKAPFDPNVAPPLGSCKIFFGNAIFGKGKYFQVFGCIPKNALENIF